MADPLTYANSDEYVLVNPSDPKVGHLIYDAPMVDAETKQFIRDPETGKIKVYRMVIWGTKGLTQAQVEALITQKNATLVTRINNLYSTLTNFLDADDTTLDQLSELITEIKSNRANIASLVTDIGKLIDPVSHLPIEATTASVGVVQLATAQDVKDGTANKVVDAKELINFAQTLPAANGVTDVSSGDNSNQLVVSRFGGSKTLTIDNVKHASNADEATTANSVAWSNVQDKPSSFNPSSHTHDDRYYTESEINTKLGGKANTSGTYNGLSVGYATSSNIANYLNGVPEIVYGVNRLNYFNIITDTTSGAENVANPENGWYYHLVMNHKDKNGYYFDIACSFHRNSIYYRRIANGTESPWVYLIDSGNISSQSVNYATTAGSANAVAWANVSGRPTAVSSFTNDSGYITSAGSCNYANSSGNADTANNLAYNYGNEINFKGGIKESVYFNYRNADDGSFTTAATVEYLFGNYGGGINNTTVSAGTFKENGTSLADKYQAKGSYVSTSTIWVE